MNNLGVLSQGHNRSTGNDVNDSGHVVGSSLNDPSYPTQRPFIYRDGSMTSLGSFGGDYGFAIGINNADQVVGLSRYSNGVTHAFLWSNGTMTDLDPQTGGYSRASGINDLGQVTGVSHAPGGVSRGFFWQDGSMSDLGDLLGGSGHTTAFAINNLGQVIGYSGAVGETETQPFIWQDSVMEHLGTLSGATGAANYARGINDLGQVVGVSGGRAFIWDSTRGMWDLNDLLHSSADAWNFTHAYDINDAGQIVGFGYNSDGVRRALLLTPVPEPSSLAIWSLLALCGIGYGWRRRGR